MSKIFHLFIEHWFPSFLHKPILETEVLVAAAQEVAKMAATMSAEMSRAKQQFTGENGNGPIERH